jgi:PLP dependent protein
MMKSFCVVPDRFASKIIRNVKERQSLVRRTRQGELEPPLLDFELAADAAALQFCMPSIAENVERVREQIAQAAEKAGRAIGEIELVAITKAHPAEKVREAIEAGQTLFGESRVQEARAKIPELPSNMHWHFVGHLQKNKIRHALPLFELFHGVDSLVLAQEMNRIAADKLREQIEQLLALQRLSILGLMTIPPLADKAEPSRKYFVQLRELRDLIQTEFHVDLRQLSMGMTQDFPIAVEEGATLVRVGTAIFGERFRLKKDLATDEH